jgi:hypothetical protein
MVLEEMDGNWDSWVAWSGARLEGKGRNGTGRQCSHGHVLPAIELRDVSASLLTLLISEGFFSTIDVTV